MKRTDFLNSLAIAGAALPIASAGVKSGTVVAGIALPDTALAHEAAHIAGSAEPAEIFNHSLRTYLFAELIGRSRGLSYDSEMLYVASILHDCGLSEQHMSTSERFEVDGANLARSLLQRHGVADARADLVWDAIALHDAGGIARWKPPLVQLVNAGVSADFGGNLSEMSHAGILQVLKAAPRSGFIETFLNATARVAAAKPDATGNCFVVDVGYRRVPGFHLTNFCDAVKENPFERFGAVGES